MISELTVIHSQELDRTEILPPSMSRLTTSSTELFLSALFSPLVSFIKCFEAGNEGNKPRALDDDLSTVVILISSPFIARQLRWVLFY